MMNSIPRANFALLVLTLNSTYAMKIPLLSASQERFSYLRHFVSVIYLAYKIQTCGGTA